MKGYHHEATSLWAENIEMPELMPLNQNLECDVVVVGGGIAGLSCAYLLMTEGKKVCLLEATELASGQSSRTSAHLSYVLGTRYFDLERIHGKSAASLVAQSHEEAIREIRRIVSREKISCDLVSLDGYLISENAEDILTLQKEREALRRLGIEGVSLIDRSPLAPKKQSPALMFPRQAQFHPTKYLRGLTEALLKGGAKIFTRTPVSEVSGSSKPFVKCRDSFKVHAEHIVVATNSPINNVVAIHTKQAPYRTYVNVFKIPKGAIARALYWDLRDPYHYVRTAPLNEIFDWLIVGGEDHKTGQNEFPDESFQKLKLWCQQHELPLASPPVYSWSGQVMESVDGIAFLGRNPLDSSRVFVISGDSGNGLTHSTVGAMLIRDLILGRKNSLESVYSPSRIRFHSTGDYLRENANVALQYSDWFRGVNGDESSISRLGDNEGMVVGHGTTKIAVYKDERGYTEKYSALCPHLGCVVAWNRVEKSWDCPCHGSRFDCHGKVIEGPATKNLAAVNEEAGVVLEELIAFGPNP